MTIFLFTNFFPYRRSEPFLVNEFPYTADCAERIVILPLYGDPDRPETTLPPNATAKRPVFLHTKAKFSMFLRGFFCLAGTSVHLRDLLYIRNFSQLRQWLISLIVTRSILSDRSFKQVVREIAATPHAILYFYWGDNLAGVLPYLRKKQQLKTVPAVVRVHRTDLYEWLKGGHIPLRPALMRSADLIVPISEDGRRYLSEKYPQHSKKIWLSRLGVPDRGVNRVSAGKPEAFVVVSVSAVIAVKRVHLILSALQKCGLPVVWHHFGDGPLLEDLRKNALNADPGLQVRLHGFKINSEVMEFYGANPVHLFINTSFSEGLPVSVMEAMSFGIPVVATNAGGTADLVNERTGVLLPVSTDADTICSAVEKVLRLDEKSYTAMRQAAREQFEQLAHAAKNYAVFYKKLKELKR